MATLHIDAPELRALFRWWLKTRRGRLMPARADFDPLDHPAPVAGEPLQFRYRLSPEGGAAPPS